MKVTVWREKILALVTEVRDLLNCVVEGGGNGGGGGEARYLQPTLASLRAAYEAWDYPGKTLYYGSLTPLCAEFRDFLAVTFANAETVNEQWERHRHRNPDRLKHADAIVLIREPANPSRDIVIDFCYGSSEGGHLADKLQCLWRDGPYGWWVDNAFIKEARK